jgi:hypothetical protein
MKKIVLLSILVALILGSSCSSLSRREKTAIATVTIIGIVLAAIVAIDHKSNKHYHKRRHHHDHGQHCRCHRCH